MSQIVESADVDLPERKARPTRVEVVSAVALAWPIRVEREGTR
jgi:hypothetical protein